MMNIFHNNKAFLTIGIWEINKTKKTIPKLLLRGKDGRKNVGKRDLKKTTRSSTKSSSTHGEIGPQLNKQQETLPPCLMEQTLRLKSS